jgi:hypothetical protein
LGLRSLPLAGRRLRRGILLAGAVLLAAASIAHVVWDWSDLRPKLSYYKQRLMEASSSSLQEALDAVAAHVQAKAFADETQKLDYVREWVNKNSIHKIDDEHGEYAAKVHLVVPMLWRHHQTSAAPPHLACGSRAYAMKAILHRLGIESRVIDVYKFGAIEPTAPQAQSHTFLEVWNRQARSWEIQDPDLNLSYRHTITGKRVSVFQMVMGNIEETVPMNPSGHGWYHLGLLGNKAFFKLAVYRLQYEGGRSVALVNYSRLRPDAKVEVGGKELDIMQFLDIGVRDPIVFTDKGLASRP